MIGDTDEPQMAYTVSIDVGIKNLAICVFEHTVGSNECLIKDWVVLNIGSMVSDINASIATPVIPCGMCKRPAKYRNGSLLDGVVFCNKHACTHTTYILPKGDLSISKITKYKLTDLKQVLSRFLPMDRIVPKTKAEWKSFYDSVVLGPIGEPAMVKTATYTEISLIEVSRILTSKLDALFSAYLNDISLVLIENQISPIATRMKSVQSMVTQYFVIKCPSSEIQYVSSIHKLDGETSTSYSERKKMGIQKCKEYLANYPEWLTYLSGHKKQDDLSDCFLQGQWYITNH